MRQAIWSEFPDGVPTRIDEEALSYYFDALVAQRRFNMRVHSAACLGLSRPSKGFRLLTRFAKPVFTRAETQRAH